MSLERELARATSDFLCVLCNRPLYADIHSKAETCINHRCTIHDRTLQALDAGSSAELHSHIEGELRAFEREISSWDRTRLVQKVYEARRDLILELWSRGRVRFMEILKLDELLSLIYGMSLTTAGTNPRSLEAMLDDFSGYFSELTTIEDLSSGRFRMAASRTMLVLKYWDIVRNEVFRNYGIVPAEAADSEGIFRYADVDAQAKRPRTAALFDFGAYFDRMFDFLSTIKYSFEMYRLTASRHDYDPTGAELAALTGLAYSSQGRVEVWSQARLATYLKKYEKSNKFVATFIRKYSGGSGLSPIVPKVGGNIIFDWHTIVFFLHYLVVKNRVRTSRQSVTGSDSFTRAKDGASKIFEERARMFLTNRGYKLVPREVRVKFGSANCRYDILAAHETKSLILVAEAKYRDPSPSSLNEDGLMDHEVLGDDGVLSWAVQEQRRLDLMPSNPDRFGELLSLKNAFDRYQKKAYVITKFRPVIRRYRQVDVVSLPEFYTLVL